MKRPEKSALPGVQVKLLAKLLPYLLCFDCGWCKWGTVDRDGKAVFTSPS